MIIESREEFGASLEVSEKSDALYHVGHMTQQSRVIAPDWDQDGVTIPGLGMNKSCSMSDQ